MIGKRWPDFWDGFVVEMWWDMLYYGGYDR
jgi:hypothetical protein